MLTSIDERSTPTRILDAAERLAQVRGFNGFSYADIADEVGVSKAALHYHFAGKAELGETLILRYNARFAESLRRIDAAGLDPVAALRAYAGLFLDVLQRGRMCLCGMLAAEFHTLPGPMQTAVRQFLDDSEAWLVRLIERGRTGGGFVDTGPAVDTARSVIGFLEGAMLLARAYPADGIERFTSAVARVPAVAGAST